MNDIDVLLAYHQSSCLGITGPSRRPSVEVGRARAKLSDRHVWRPPSTDGPLSTTDLAEVAEAVSDAYSPDQNGQRNIPSAGALYRGAITLADIATGTALHVRSSGQEVRLIDDRSADLAGYIYDRFLEGVLVVFSMLLGDLVHRYGPRGYRYALLEAGHFGQELIRSANRRHLGIRPIGAFNDYALASFFGLDVAGLVPLYVLVVGRNLQ
jgi:Nitroreductase family